MKHLFVFLLMLGSAIGADPTSQPAPKPTVTANAIIGADKPIPLGELVDLSVTFQATVKDAQTFSTDWSVYDLELRKEQKFKFYRENEGGRKEGIVFGSGTEPKEMIVHCAVTYLLVTKENDKIVEAGTKTEMLKAKIIIGTSTPKPPTPGPNVSPTVTFPNEKLGLSTKVYKSITERGPPIAKAKGAAVLAASFRGSQSQVAAGTVKEPIDILKNAQNANVSALKSAGLNRDDWLEVFKVIQDEIYPMYENGTISSPSDFSVAFGEIADAFAAVK